jgi:hypothetical protein
MAEEELPKLMSDEEFAVLVKQRKQFDRAEHERWNNAGEARSKAAPTDGKPESTLEQHFPRVAQKLTAVWRSEACASYLKDLMVTERNTRQGFPPDVVEDLLMLYLINEMFVGRTRPVNASASRDPWPEDRKG